MIGFGLGLLSIGRSWGVVNAPVPSPDDARALIDTALTLGVRFFDTAPAYGASEELFGKVLAQMSPERRAEVTVATKMGEFWEGDDLPTRVCHESGALVDSIERSLNLLGQIDILQLHKSNRSVIESSGLRDAIDFARSKGITSFGASVSDLDSARTAIESGLFSWLQFPYNIENNQFGVLAVEMRERGMRAMINRPLAMGKLADGLKKGFSFVAAGGFPEGSILLSGTGSVKHLLQNVETFQRLNSQSVIDL